MWFKIDFNRLSILLLPTFLRKQNLVKYVQALVTPIGSLHYKWSNWRIENIFKIEYSGQVCYLRKSLNDKFDPLQRRIRIGDGNIHEVTYIYTEVELQNAFLHTENESQIIWIRSEAETASTGLDFIVFVPQEVYDSDFFGLHAHIKFYKAGGKRYNILIDE
ncbi:hypothetical protein NJT12_03275 [Flavobacterium sp. AC]|uniref:Uncharacterized protein n=1 Tax=Flavobacterium azizsancarii TaxID=2961580 RepID=A0ABT4W7W8_9FLAO|nr:hypothetical protein [Flavobacterium azizsancarii]MDA6068632.1 hypothetical protein [Flavobacterium azizsancarii]